MMKNRIVKTLSNLFLLLALCTGQVAAATELPVANSASIREIPPEVSEPQVFTTQSEQPNLDTPPATEHIVRISGEAGGDHPSISMDGHYIAYESAGNIIFHSTYTNSKVTIGSGTNPAISANGLFTAYTSNGYVYLYDAQAGNIKSIGPGESPSISGDGQFIAVELAYSVLIYDTVNNETIHVLDASGYSGTKTFSMSSDGRYVAYISAQASDPNSRYVFLYNRENNNSTPLTQIYSANSPAKSIAISADGHYIVYSDGFQNEASIDEWTHFEIYNTQTSELKEVYVNNPSSTLPQIAPYVSISADGYVAYATEIDSPNQIYIYASQTGATTRVSTPIDGSAPNFSSYRPSISADGQYVAFASFASNLVNGDTNGVTDIFVSRATKQPLILVHGFADKHTCEQGIHRYSERLAYNDHNRTEYVNANSTFDMGDGRTNIADWFTDLGYDVWIAHWTDTVKDINTPSISTSGTDCLRKQINIVGSETHQPIKIVAHSMGGQVTRVAIQELNPDTKVTEVYTMGTPHAGFPVQALFATGPILGWAPAPICLNKAACEEINTNTIIFNSQNPNIRGIKYYFIGGNANPLQVEKQVGCWFFWELEGGKTDCFPGSYSTVGWTDFQGEFSPTWWPSASMPEQFWTDETHSGNFDKDNNYYSETSSSNHSDAFECIKTLMQGSTPSTSYCYPPTQSPPYIQSSSSVGTWLGTLDTGNSTSVPFKIDSEGKSTFYLTYDGATPPDFTLTRPDNQIIDQAYVNAYPNEVSYEASEDGGWTRPYIIYRFNATQPGAWYANITATSATSYKVFASAESLRTLTFETDTNLYQAGDDSLITVHLENGGTGITQAAITAEIVRPDSIIDTVSLNDQGNGVYTATYNIPSTSGTFTINVNASGTDNGVEFTRQALNSILVASNDVLLTGSYSEATLDANADGLYDSLNITAGINVSKSGKYVASADIYTGSQLVAHASETVDLTSLDQNITFSFGGDKIRSSGLDGPYTVTHLLITSIEQGAPSDSQNDVLATSTYNYTQFGTHPCYILTLGHNGAGTNPIATPEKSDGCYTNEYEPGTIIDLTATPDAGLIVSGWTGTIANGSKSTTNLAVMPSSSHAITANYSSEAPTPPNVASSLRSDSNPTSASSVNFTVTFSEAVTGVDISDFVLTADGVTGATVGSVSGSGNTYTVTADTGTGNGTIRLDVLNDGSIINAASAPLSGGYTSGEFYTIVRNVNWENTFLGGSGLDKPISIASDEDGNLYIMGVSDTDWGTPIRPYSGNQDVFVAKVGTNGLLLWNTFLGGSGWDNFGRNIIVDGTGSIYIGGASDGSWGTPTRAYGGGGQDGFVAKLNSSTGDLIWNSFLGGNGIDRSSHVAVDENQNVYVSGDSSDTWGAPVRNYALDLDGFAAKLDSSGGLVWNTFIGGSGTDVNYGITLDNNNSIYISGSSKETWGNPIRPYTTGLEDAHVVGLDNSGNLIWNTFLGGSDRDLLYDIIFSLDGSLYLAGQSVSAWGDPVSAYIAGQDGIAVKLDSSGTLLWNTFFGSSGTDYGYDIKQDENGNINIAGGSDANWGNPARAYTSNYDAILVKLSSSGGLLANTFLGGNGIDKGYSSIQANGSVYLTGYSDATWDTPVQPYSGSFDTFVAKFDLSTAPPIVSSITRNAASPTDATNVDYTVTFSEAVTGVDVSDFTVLGSVTNPSITSVNGSDNTYIVNVDTGTGNGTIRLDVVDDGTIVSANGESLGGIGDTNGNYGTGQSYAIDKPVAPTIYTLVLQPNGTGGVDTYLLSGAASSNYGSNTGMGIGEKNSAVGSYARALIKFDLSALPSDAVITSADLSLWTSTDYADNDGTVNVFRLKKPFNETQATWNLAATGVNWQSPGASGVEDRESVAIGSVQISASEAAATEKQISLSPEMIQEMFDGTFTNNGFLLATSAELNDRFDFKTSDVGSSLASQRPKLVIQYTSATNPPPTNLLFTDGFESGDFSAWSSSTLGGGDLSVSATAAMTGTNGMQALVNDLTSIYVADQTPTAETEFRARFQFDPNSIGIPNNNNFTIASGSDTSGTAWRLTLNYSSGTYKLQSWAMTDSGVWSAGTQIPIQDLAQTVEIEYKSIANAGYLKLWINDTLVDTIANVDNDTMTVGTFYLGAVNGLDTGTSGTIYFDAVETYDAIQ